ncbi:TPA: hypothetical protein ACJXXT_000232 [Pseudomonas aeruginosa]
MSKKHNRNRQKKQEKKARYEHEQHLISHGLESIINTDDKSSIDDLIDEEKTRDLMFSIAWSKHQQELSKHLNCPTLLLEDYDESLTPEQNAENFRKAKAEQRASRNENINSNDAIAEDEFSWMNIRESIFNLFVGTIFLASFYSKNYPSKSLIPLELSEALFVMSAATIVIFMFVNLIGCFCFEENSQEQHVVAKINTDSPKPVITPKRIKKDLHSTNILLFQSPMTASIDEQLSFANKANEQILANDVVIAAFDKEKTIDLTIANERLKKLLSTVENSVLQEIK